MKQSEDYLPVSGWFNFGQELRAGKDSREIKGSEMSSGENCQLLKRQHSPASLPPRCPEGCICDCIQVKAELNICRCSRPLRDPGKEQNLFHPFLNVEVPLPVCVQQLEGSVDVYLGMWGWISTQSKHCHVIYEDVFYHSVQSCSFIPSLHVSVAEF